MGDVAGVGQVHDGHARVVDPLAQTRHPGWRTNPVVGQGRARPVASRREMVDRRALPPAQALELLSWLRKEIAHQLMARAIGIDRSETNPG